MSICNLNSDEYTKSPHIDPSIPTTNKSDSVDKTRNTWASLYPQSSNLKTNTRAQYRKPFSTKNTKVLNPSVALLPKPPSVAPTTPPSTTPNNSNTINADTNSSTNSFYKFIPLVSALGLGIINRCYCKRENYESINTSPELNAGLQPEKTDPLKIIEDKIYSGAVTWLNKNPRKRTKGLDAPKNAPMSLNVLTKQSNPNTGKPFSEDEMKSVLNFVIKELSSKHSFPLIRIRYYFGLSSKDIKEITTNRSAIPARKSTTS